MKHVGRPNGNDARTGLSSYVAQLGSHSHMSDKFKLATSGRTPLGMGIKKPIMVDGVEKIILHVRGLRVLKIMRH